MNPPNSDDRADGRGHHREGRRRRDSNLSFWHCGQSGVRCGCGGARLACQSACIPSALFQLASQLQAARPWQSRVPAVSARYLAA
jgi:hypothetical protein